MKKKTTEFREVCGHPQVNTLHTPWEQLKNRDYNKIWNEHHATEKSPGSKLRSPDPDRHSLCSKKEYLS